MNSFEKLLSDNKDWANEMVVKDPTYFSRLSNLQEPEFLWIGCSDSRVPANQITGTQPGQIFVHRNIANLVVNTDINMLSVLQYAVEVLKVKHVIVCGHYGCGGVKAAMNQHHYGIINHWLKNIKDVYRFHREEIESLPTEEQKVNRLTELNVREQVFNLSKTSIIQSAWKYHQRPHLHGWVYGLQDGLINPIVDIAPGAEIDELYHYENL